MAFDLKEINFRTVADPKGFIEECDDVYASRVKDAAEKIIENSRNNRRIQSVSQRPSF